MKDYKTVAEDVFRRSAEEIELNKLRRKKRIEICVSAACWAAVAAVGVGVWTTSRRHDADMVTSEPLSANDSKDQESDSVISSTTKPIMSCSSSCSKAEPVDITKGNGTGSSYSESEPSTKINGIDIRCYPTHSNVMIPSHTRIGLYGSGSMIKYDTPKNGQVIFDKSLKDAMADYGKSDEYGEIMYDVIIEYYKDGKRVDPTRELWESELERFGGSYYLETDNTDPDKTRHYTGIRSAGYEMLENFTPSEEYGYFVVLRGDLFDGIDTGPNERLYSHGDHTASFELEGADFCNPRGSVSNIDLEITEDEYSPENRTVVIAKSLKMAIATYGREDKNGEIDYRVILEYYKDGERIDSTKEIWESEQARGAGLNLETYSTEWGKNVEHRIYRYMTMDEINNFEPSGEYGYVLHLYNAYLGNPYSLKDNIVNGLYNNGVYIDR